MAYSENDVGSAFAAIAKRELETLREKAQGEFDRLALENRTRFSDLEEDSRERLNLIQTRTESDIRSKGYAIGAAVIALAVLGVLSGVLTARHEIEQSVIDLNKDVIAAQSSVLSSRTDVTTAAQTLSATREQLITQIKVLETISEEYKKKAADAAALIGELQRSRDDYKRRVAELSSFDPGQTQTDLKNLREQAAKNRADLDHQDAELRLDTKLVITGRDKCPNATYRPLGALLVGINTDYSGSWNEVLEVARDSAGNTIRLSPTIDPKWVVAHPTLCMRK